MYYNFPCRDTYFWRIILNLLLPTADGVGEVMREAVLAQAVRDRQWGRHGKNMVRAGGEAVWRQWDKQWKRPADCPLLSAPQLPLSVHAPSPHSLRLPQFPLLPPSSLHTASDSCSLMSPLPFLFSLPPEVSSPTCLSTPHLLFLYACKLCHWCSLGHGAWLQIGPVAVMQSWHCCSSPTV